MPLPQPNRERDDGGAAGGASDTVSRTPVPDNGTESTVQDDQFTSEVTAQRMSAAFDAVTEVLAVIQRHRHDLSHLPAGRALVERADRVRALYPSTDEERAAEAVA
jgi:hypothetical protein